MAKRLGAFRRLVKRPQYLEAAKGSFWATPTVVAQFRRRGAPDALGARLGFTASKKVGGAVARNRARRRLKAAALAIDGALWRPEGDYVLVARAETATCAFDRLLGDLAEALTRAPNRRPRR